MKWQPGRQGTGYRKLPIFQISFADMYLIHYPVGAYVPTHTDVVEGKKHYRLNIILWGEDNFQGQTLFSTKRIKFFRPDLTPHNVDKVTKNRLVLSLGWAI